MMEHPVPVFHATSIPIDGSSYLDEEHFVCWCRWSLEKQILSASSKERRCAGGLLGEMPMPSGSCLRLL